ncbi:VOC family protein [Dyadobacter sp. CY345]|uniref:VOC family protein n=1 Tax=Dyadobacter sp. CY345 TaxID=2909335 RepID=UPI001F1738F4|nr:VOC family protein [Dyadobacter sp. CY345]MCF2443668.1 VOC family protein [Dyadobacter sp. CY345]
MMIKFAYTILYVTDVASSISFYETAFGLQRRFISPDQDYAELVTGETTISFASKDLANTNLSEGFIESNSASKPFGIEIGFAVDDVEQTLNDALKAGALLVEKPKTKPWGQTVAYVKDIDGFLIEICTSMEG